MVDCESPLPVRVLSAERFPSGTEGHHFMSIEVTCPNGHQLKVKDRWAGKTGRCPKCNAKMKVPTPKKISDDEVLALIGDFVPMEVDPPPEKKDKPSDDENVLNEYESAMQQATSGMSLLGSSVVAHKKKCKKCGKSSNLWFATCEHCGEYFEQE